MRVVRGLRNEGTKFFHLVDRFFAIPRLTRARGGHRTPLTFRAWS